MVDDLTLPRAASRPPTASSGLRLAWLVALAAPLVILLALPGLHEPLSAARYLPVHTVLELLVVGVAFATFGVQWFAAREFPDRRAQVIGPAFLAVGLFEALHLLTFPGMPGVGGPGTTERGIYYWFLARLWTVGTLVWVARLPPSDRSLRPGRARLLVPHLVAVTAFVAVELALPGDRAFFYVEGGGLTSAKVGLELFVAAVALVGALVHHRAARAGDRGARTLAAALAVTVLSELSLTLYARPFDPVHVLGHAYLVLTFFLIFRALFVGAVVAPHRELVALRSHIENELNVTIAELRATKESREDLLRAVSHDLRNPLQIVLLKAQVLGRHGAKPGAAEKAARDIALAGRRMERMLRDLADAARLESGAALALQRAAVDVRAFVAEAIELNRGVFDPQRLEVAVPDGLPPVHADPDRLDRVLVNLVGNALKHTAGRVVVSANPAGAFVRISVMDEGPGIAPEDQQRIFQRYVRGPGREADGLGLGLYIVRRLVEAHGGEVELVSAPAAGSTFSFTLPVATPG
ncbi:MULTISPECIES: MASE3 domain-containing protein [Anaeromyxobacter]|uniref:sensor histidine kinase n=1 Tax=Anaeromyxobacter TaxID=161492 RepID=UPI001F595EA1|nr:MULTISPECIES: MASE3 domain-containing protein [unclassified Anaeromyxobacter]